MIERGYQTEYSRGNAEMHSEKGRRRKAATMLAVLQQALSGKLAHADVLNLGCSTGIIDEFLAPHVCSMTGVDIDEPAVKLAESRTIGGNVSFRVEDAMALNFPDASFDIVICSQVYEHVPHAVRMMSEIDRILRHGGVCYFAATNRWSIVEKHYHLPFLSWLPPALSNAYLKILGRGSVYYEKHLGYRDLLGLVSGFDLDDWTGRLVTNPELYGTGYMFPGRASRGVAKALFDHCRPMFPGFIWLLWKRGAEQPWTGRGKAGP